MTMRLHPLLLQQPRTSRLRRNRISLQSAAILRIALRKPLVPDR